MDPAGRQLTDTELIEAAERIVSDLQAFEKSVNRNLWFVAWVFGIPFLIYVTPMIYDSLPDLRPSAVLLLASGGMAFSLALYFWRRRGPQP